MDRMNEGGFGVHKLAEATPGLEKPVVPKPRSDSRPAGNRLAGVLRLLREPWTAPMPGGPMPSESSDSNRVDLIHPDVETGAASSATPASVEAAPKVDADEISGEGTALERRDDPPVDEHPTDAAPQMAEHEAHEEVTEDDRALVRSTIRELQKAGTCPDGCFPLRQEDLDHLAVLVHGIPADGDTDKIIRDELQAIEQRRAEQQ